MCLSGELREMAIEDSRDFRAFSVGFKAQWRNKA